MSITSKEIEERVVAMRFDNDDFEKKTKQTMSTLDKLKASLDFRGVSKGFLDVAENSNILHKNIQVLGSGVSSIQREFSSLEVIGATCLVNLTNSAIKAGKTIVNALTIQPVTTGFQEYETKMGSIQTILTNTAKHGTTMREVIDVIDELNVYADKTIYNFSQMTRNIGTFTAAGIELKPAAAAIQGIANLAAASGSTSQQASTAMYQLSQALAAGSVKLQDWNSVVNAGMGGTLFQDALKDTAREMGIDVDAMIEQAGSFRNSLQQGWITAEVLSTTLNKFTKKGAKEYGEQMMANGKYTEEQNKALEEQANRMEDAATQVKTFTQLWDTLKETAQSGWGKTWELIVGDYEQAKEFFTRVNAAISPLIDRMAESRNTFIEKVLGSPSKWDDIVVKFNKAGIGMESIKKGVAETFQKRGIIKNLEEFDALLEEAGDDYTKLFVNAKDKGINNWVGVREGLLRAIRDNKEYSETTMTAQEKLKKFQEVVTDVWQGDYGNQSWNKERQKALEAEGWEYERVQRLVNLVTEAKSGEALVMADLTEEDLRSLGLTKEEIKAFQQLQEEIKDTNSALTQMFKTVLKDNGRQVLMDSLFNIGKAIMAFVTPIKQAYDEVFGGISYEAVYDMIERFREFTKSLILNEEQASKLKNVFITLFNVFDTVKTVLSTGFRLALSIIGKLLGAMNIDLGNVFKALADGTTSLRKFVKENDLVAAIMERIGPAIVFVGQAITRASNAFKDSGLWDGIKSFFSDKLQNFSVGGILDGIGFAMSTVRDFIVDKFFDFKGLFTDGLTKTVEDSDPKAVEDAVAKGTEKMLSSVKMGIGDALGLKVIGESKDEKQGKKLGKTIFKGIKDTLIKAFTTVATLIKGAFTWFQENIGFDKIISLLSIVGLLKITKQITDTLYMFAKPLNALGDVFNATAGLINSAKKNLDYAKTNMAVNNFLKVCAGLVLMAKAISELSEVNVYGAAFALGILTILIFEVQETIYALNKGLTGTVISSAAGTFIGISVMILALAKAVLMLCDLDEAQMVYGLSATAGLMALVTAFILIVGKVQSFKTEFTSIATLGAVIIGLGLSLQRMIDVVKIAGDMRPSELKQGMNTIWQLGIIMSGIVLALSIGKKSFVGSAGVGIAVLGISIAMQILLSTVERASEVSKETMYGALENIGILIGIITAITVISRIGKGGTAGLAMISWMLAFAMLPMIIKEINTLNLEDLDTASKIIGSIKLLWIGMTIASKFAGKYALRAAGLITASTLMVAALVPVLAILANIAKDNPEGLKRAAIIVGVLLGIMSMVVLFSSLPLQSGENKAKGAVIACGIIVALLAGVAVAISMAAKNGTTELFVGFGCIIAVLMAVGFVLIAASTITKDVDKQAGTDKSTSIGGLITMVIGMYAIIGAIGVVVGLLAAISNHFKFTDALIQSAASIAMIMIALATTISLLAKYAPKNGEGKISSMWIMLGMIGALGVFMVALAAGLNLVLKSTTKSVSVTASIGAVNSPSDVLKDQFFGRLIAMISTLFALTAMAIWIAKTANKMGNTKIEWASLGQIGVSLVGMGIALLGVGLLIKALQSDVMSIQDIDMKFVQKIALMLGTLVGLIACAAMIAFISNRVDADANDFNNVEVAVYAMGLALLGVAAVFKGINSLEVVEIDWMLLGQLLAALLGLTVVAGLLTFIANKNKSTGADGAGTTNVKELIGPMLVIAELAVVASIIANDVMPALNGIDSNNILNATGSLIMVMVAIGIIAGLMSILASATFRSGPGYAQAMLGEAGMLALTTLVAEYVTKNVMPSLNSIDSSNIVNAAIALGIVLVALGTVTALLGVIANHTKPDIGYAQGMLGEAGMLALLMLIAERISGELMSNLNKINSPNILNATAALCAILIGLCVATAICAAMSKAFGGAALEGTVVLAAIGLIGETLGALAALFVAEYGDDVMAGFEAASSHLPNIADNLKKFGDVAATIPDISAQASALKTLTGVFSDIAWNQIGQEVLDPFNLTDTFVTKFETDLTDLANAVARVLEVMDDLELNPDAVEKFASCVRPIIALQWLLYGENGALQKILGEKDLSAFGEMITTFATNLKDFMLIVTKFGDLWTHKQPVVDFCEAAKPVIELQKTLYGSGGWKQKILGEKDLEEFGGMIEGFAGNMKDFMLVVTRWGNLWSHRQEVDDFAYCADALIKIANAIPNQGGWLGRIVGDNDIATFGTKLTTFATGMKNANEVIVANTWNKAKYSAFKSCADVLVEFSNSLDDGRAWYQKLVGDDVTSFGTFSTNLTAFAEGMSAFSDNMNKENNIFKEDGAAKKIMDNISDMLDAMPDADKWASFNDKFSVAWDTYGVPELMSNLGEALNNFAEKTKTIDTGQLTTATYSFTQLMDALSNSDGDDFNKITSFNNELENVSVNGLASFTRAFYDAYYPTSSAISTFFNNIIATVTRRRKEVLDIFDELPDKIIDSVTSNKNRVVKEFRDLANEIVSAFEGIKQRLYDVGVNLMRGLIDGMKSEIEAVKAEADRVASSVGPVLENELEINSPSKLTTRIGEFVGMGLVNGMRNMETSVSENATNLAYGMSRAINDAVNSFDDSTLNPTITPILDMSEVQNGFGSINSLLDGYTVNARAQLAGGIYTSATNDDVISSIAALGDILGVPSGNTYNINGITYDDGSNVASAVSQLIYAANIARRS